MNAIKFKIKKSNKLENLVGEIKSILSNKESSYKYSSNISKICDLGIIRFIECNMENSIEISIEEKTTNTNSFKKNTGLFFLLFLNNNRFKIKDLISIDYLESNKSKIVAKTWRDVKKAREEKYKILFFSLITTEKLLLIL